MRPLLSLIALVGLAAIGWLALVDGTEYPHLRGASQISAQIEAEATAAADAAGGGDIRIAVDGRKVHLSGEIATAEELDTLIGAITQIPLAAEVTHDIAIAEPPAPAEQVTPPEPVAVEDGSETGDVAANDDPGTPEATADPLSATVAPVASQPVEPAVPEGVYYVRARKTVDGTILLSGKVPDASTRKALITAAEALTDVPLVEKIEAAEDFPSTIWLNLNRQGLEALAWMETGDLSTVGSEVSMHGTVSTKTEHAQLMALAQPDWVMDVEVLNTDPDAEASLSMAADGTITGSGLLPKGLTAEAFAELLPGLSVDGLEVESVGREIDWTPALDGLGIVLTRLESAEIRLDHNHLYLSGTLKDGYSVDGLDASLRTAMTDGWTVSLAVEAPPPESVLILSKADRVVGLSGVLPRGISPADTLALFGDGAGGDGLTEGGLGDPAEWRNALTGTSELLELFVEATGAVSSNRIALTGTLKSGYDPEAVRAWQIARTGADWVLELDAETAPPQDGDLRRVLIEEGSGFDGEERYVNGYWLTTLDFAPSLATCKAETEAQQAADKVTFITASARFDQGGAETLDRLGAILLQCADIEGMQLEIGGHTDSVGNDAANLRLSEKRAQVVLDEMIKRGVRADLMTAVGYGESEPIASNNTADGRARNRRITFNWSETDQ